MRQRIALRDYPQGCVSLAPAAGPDDPEVLTCCSSVDNARVNAHDRSLADCERTTGAPRWRSDSFARSLGPGFAVPVAAAALPSPHWVARSKTLAFRRMSGFDSHADAASAPIRDLYIDRPAFDALPLRYAGRLRSEPSNDAELALPLNRFNPKFVLRNHLAEGAIERARSGDFDGLRRIHRLLEHPFHEQPESEADAGFPPDWAAQLEVSCSS